MSDKEEQQLKVRNMQAMLNWAIENGSHGSAPTLDGAVQQGDPEFEIKRQHLMAALQSVTVDIVKIIRDAIQVLQLPDDAADAEGKKNNALEELLDLIEDLNNAEDFQKMGGIDLCMTALASSHTSVQWRGADCVGSAIQNHIPLQNYFGKIGGVQEVLQLLAAAEAPMVKVKLVRCLSCSLGGHAGNIKGFVENKGMESLAALLSTPAAATADGGSSSDNIKVAVKVVFLLAGLIDDHSPIAAVAREAGLVEKVVATLRTSADPVLWEQCLRVLVRLSSADGGCHARLKEPSLGVALLLADRAGYVAAVAAEDKPMHEEEEAHAAALLATLETEPAAPVPVASARILGPATPTEASPGGGALVVVPGGGGGSSGSAASIAVTEDDGPKVEFIATYEWQAILDNHILPAGLDIKIDLKHGTKFARMTPPAEGSTPDGDPGAAST